MNVAHVLFAPCESGFYQLTRACYLGGLATLMKAVSLIALVGLRSQFDLNLAPYFAPSGLLRALYTPSVICVY